MNFFSGGVKYYKNGMWYWSKMIARAVGEDRYDKFRLTRRIQTNRFYYFRQTLLYKFYVDYPDIANSVGLYPKVDSSHGYLHLLPYEPFRDWQENSPNSEGWFANFVLYVCAIYCIMTLYSYVLPSIWSTSNPIKDADLLYRLKDYYSTTAFEESLGSSILEMMMAPHSFHRLRSLTLQNYTTTDDPRMIFTGSVNRKHKYREHYWTAVGHTGSMTTSM